MTTPMRSIPCDDVRDLAPLFVTGALEPAEAAAVRAHLLMCPEPHPEVAELGATAQVLLATVEPAEPSAGLRDRLLAAASADLAEGRHPSSHASATAPAAVDPRLVAVVAPVDAPSAVAALPSDAETTTPIPLSLASRQPTRWLRAALALAAVVILVLGGLGLRLKSDLDAAQAYRNGVEAALALAAQPGSQTVLLAADNGSASGLGVVGADGTVKLAMRGLAPTAGTQVYTAWSISGGGAPVPIGEFTVGSDGTATGTAHAPAPAAGVVVALTLEAHPGATTPTLPIVAKGVARPASG